MGAAPQRAVPALPGVANNTLLFLLGSVKQIGPGTGMCLLKQNTTR
jgi:hypothetical protein